MAEIDHLDRSDAIQLAKKMRNKMRNLETNKKELLTSGTHTLVAGVAAFGMGRIMGGLEAEYRADQAAIDAGTAEDPRKIAGIDWDALAGGTLVALGLAGVATQKGPVAKLADVFLAAGDGVMSGYLYSLGVRQGLEAAQQG